MAPAAMAATTAISASAAPPDPLAVPSSTSEAVGSAWGEPVGVGCGWGDPVPKRGEVPVTTPTSAASMDMTAAVAVTSPCAKASSAGWTQASTHNVNLSSFLSRHLVDAAAEAALRELPVEGQRRVMGYGPLVSSDASSELLARVREVSSLCCEGGNTRPAVGTEGPVGQLTRDSSIKASAEAPPRTLPHDLVERERRDDTSRPRSRSPRGVAAPAVGAQAAPAIPSCLGSGFVGQQPVGPPGGMPSPPPGVPPGGPPGGMPPPPPKAPACGTTACGVLPSGALPPHPL